MSAVAGLRSPASVRETGNEFRFRKGLDVSIAGAPRQEIEPGRRSSAAGLLGADFPGLRPKLLVEQGNRVRLGQPLFADRRDPRIVFTAPGSGRVTAIRLGERRTLSSLVISLEGDCEQVTFQAHPAISLARLPRETVIEALLKSGLWTALRTRPFGRVPLPDAAPRAIFVTAIDTNPLAVRPEIVVEEHAEHFEQGLKLIGRVAGCPVFLCTTPDLNFDDDGGRITRVSFAGPHPAGLPGTHIHFLSPAGIGHEVWYIGYQDIIAIGHLFTTGRLWSERVVALAGPAVRRPRLVRTGLGADLSELVDGELTDDAAQVLSGPVLAGRPAEGPLAYLGRFHLQVTALNPPMQRGTLHRWLPAGAFDRLVAPRYPAPGTGNGRPAAMLPLDRFERVMPLDVLPTPLLRALAAGDSERALDLGCLELEEDDLALCSFVCPSGLDYGALLRRTLAQLEKEL